MNILMMTMVYNETFWLKRWVAYYGQQVGFKNCLIIDHGMNDGSLSFLPREINKLRLPRDKGMNEIRRARAVVRMQQGLFQYYDYVIYVDADEFLVPDPWNYNGLVDFLDQNPDKFLCPIGFNVVQKISSKEKFDRSLPILGQRKYCAFAPPMCKPVINKVPATFGPGFHSLTEPPNVRGDIYLFHLKDFDVDVRLDRQKTLREINWAGEGHNKKISGADRWMWTDEEVRKHFRQFDLRSHVTDLCPVCASEIANHARSNITKNTLISKAFSNNRDFYQVGRGSAKKFKDVVFRLSPQFFSLL